MNITEIQDSLITHRYKGIPGGTTPFRLTDIGQQGWNVLQQSIELDDNLPYAEPWGWMQPTRHALGALLLEQGHIAEAEQIYRADLGLDNTLSRASRHPSPP